MAMLLMTCHVRSVDQPTGDKQMIREVCHAHAAQNCIKCESPDQEPEIELVKFRCGQYGVRKTKNSSPVFIDFEVWELYMNSGDERDPWNTRGYKGFDSFSMLKSEADAIVVLNRIKQDEQELIDARSEWLLPTNQQAGANKMSELELCISCDELTGRAGKGEDSLYREDDTGPFCEDCFDTLQQGESVEPEQDLKANTELGEKLLSVWLDHCSEDASSGDETLMSDLEDGELLLEAIEALNTAQADKVVIERVKSVLFHQRTTK